MSDLTIGPAGPTPPVAVTALRSGRDLLRVTAGAAAVGAGLIHAATVGPHTGHGAMPGLFSLASVIGVASGVAVLVRPTRPVLVAVVVAHLAMLATWVASRTTGVSFVSGLEDREAVGYPDAVAAAFAVLVVGCGVALFRPPRRVEGRGPRGSVAVVAVVPIALALALVGGPAVYVGATTEHGHGVSAETADGHDHGDGADHADGDDHGPPAVETAGAATEGHGDAGHSDGAEPVPFDPTAPIDLSGTPGVSPVQQHEAELLLAKTLAQLPAFADQKVANAAGYHSIGDSMTGDEHLINWDAINDQYVLDPAHPESLVYNTRNGAPELEAAMFILPDGYTLDNVPNVGGSLIQWHIHDDLCFTEGTPPVLAGVRSPGGPCRPGAVAFRPSPMIHVWIAKNACGPFSALEGVGAGRTKTGVRDCDHAHGSTGSTF